MSETVQLTPEQELKNLKDRNLHLKNLLDNISERFGNYVHSKIENNQKYSTSRDIDSLNKELVNVTSKLIKADQKCNEDAIKQAYITGKIEILNSVHNFNEDILVELKNIKTLLERKDNKYY